MAEYAELQEKAKLLGLKHIAVSKKQLVQSISQAEANRKSSTETKSHKKEQSNAALVMKGNQEIRRYTLELHGDNFIELATQFAKKRDYVVQFKKIKSGVVCPSCGYVITTE